jgi:hypothetical protein
VVVKLTEITTHNTELHHRHHKHQELDPLTRSVSRVTTVLANVSSVFQFFFLVVCSDMIFKGFGLVAIFASVETSSVCIHLSCLVCIQSVVHGVRRRLFCGRKGCSLLEVSITSFLPLQFFVSELHINLSLSPHIAISLGKWRNISPKYAISDSFLNFPVHSLFIYRSVVT